MSDKKKFKDTGVGKFLLNKIPNVVGAIAGDTPVGSVIKAIIGGSNMSITELLPLKLAAPLILPPIDKPEPLPVYNAVLKFSPGTKAVPKAPESKLCPNIFY